MARLLKVSGELGKQLDSLADMVTFGVVPGLMVFQYASLNIHDGETVNVIINYLPYLALCIPVFSAFRLAKFNIDTRQSENFIGLPTPANALFFVSVLLLASKSLPSLVNISFFNSLFLNPFLLIGISVLFSLLLVSEIAMFSLKVKSLSWEENKWVFSFVIYSILLFTLFFVAAIPIVIISYILLSLIKMKRT